MEWMADAELNGMAGHDMEGIKKEFTLNRTLNSFSYLSYSKYHVVLFHHSLNFLHFPFVYRVLLSLPRFGIIINRC